MPKMKTHCQTLFTGAVKNMFGIIPDTRKAAMHFRYKKLGRFSDMLADLVTTFRPDISIMDAVVAMEGQGPGTGDPINSGFIAVSDDPVYLDSFCCSIAGIRPKDVEILVRSELAGLGNMADMACVRNDFSHLVTRDFRLPETRSSLLKVIPLPEKVTSFLSDFLMKSPVIDQKKCISCGKCEHICPADPKAVLKCGEKTKKYTIDLKKCIKCYCCHEVCPEKAVKLKRKLF
jgi:ferredoxin